MKVTSSSPSSASLAGVLSLAELFVLGPASDVLALRWQNDCRAGPPLLKAACHSEREVRQRESQYLGGGRKAWC